MADYRSVADNALNPPHFAKINGSHIDLAVFQAYKRRTGLDISLQEYIAATDYYKRTGTIPTPVLGASANEWKPDPSKFA